MFLSGILDALMAGTLGPIVPLLIGVIVGVHMGKIFRVRGAMVGILAGVANGAWACQPPGRMFDI